MKNQQKLARLLNLDLRPTPGLLPIGVPGSGIKPISRKQVGTCKSDLKGQKVTVLHWDKNQKESFESFFGDLNRKFGSKFSVRVVEPADAIARTYSRSDEHLIVMSIDSPENNLDKFFKPFYHSETVLPAPIARLSKIVTSLSKAWLPVEIERLASEAHRTVLDSAFTLPLGQVYAVQYYPKWIKNVFYGSKGQGFPLISKMKTEQ